MYSAFSETGFNVAGYDAARTEHCCELGDGLYPPALEVPWCTKCCLWYGRAEWSGNFCSMARRSEYVGSGHRHFFQKYIRIRLLLLQLLHLYSTGLVLVWYSTEEVTDKYLNRWWHGLPTRVGGQRTPQCATTRDAIATKCVVTVLMPSWNRHLINCIRTDVDSECRWRHVRQPWSYDKKGGTVKFCGIPLLFSSRWCFDVFTQNPQCVMVA